MQQNIKENQKTTDLISPVKRLVSPVKRLQNPFKRIYPDEEASAILMTGGPADMEEPEFQVTHATPIPIARGIRKLIVPPKYRWVADAMRWEAFTPGDWIYIQAGTGLGKTTYLENFIIPNFPKVLYLTNRISNRTQFALRNRYKLNLTIMSYQQLERDVFKDSAWLDLFDVIICDEFQYIHADATFSNTCGITVRKLLGTVVAIKIMVSATLDYAAEYMLKQLEKRKGFEEICNMVRFYEFPTRVPSFTSVSEVDREWLIPVIKKSEHKWLIFVESSKDGKEYEDRLGSDALFIDRERIESGGEAKKVYDKLMEDECFDKKILIATAVIDSGVNIKDTSLKGLVLDVDNMVQMKQMLGRKRFGEEDDSASVFIIHRSISELKVKAQLMKKSIEEYTENHNKLMVKQFPEQLIADDGKAADDYRQTICCDEQIRMFCCNFLGKYDLQKQLNELWALIRSGNPFELKLCWLFGNAYKTLPIETTMETLVQQRIGQLHALLAPHVGKVIPKLGEETRKIQKEFSNSYWQFFGINKEENQRADRTLSIDKINGILNAFGIPIELEQKYIKKKSHIEVKEKKNERE